jgi:hypothetical protein
VGTTESQFGELVRFTGRVMNHLLQLRRKQSSVHIAMTSARTKLN